ncbi:MAG: PAS domain-containing protein [Verrucomicrobiae bacterium]|nr:PAS domain-containing protein [Verrucomicrobiae bacterium]
MTNRLWLCIFFTFLCLGGGPGTFAGSPDVSPPALTLRVGVTRDYPPFSFLDAHNKPSGFAIELLEAIAREKKIALTYTVDSRANIQKMLIEGRVDVVPDLIFSAQRDEFADFTPPYLISHSGLFVRKDNRSIRSVGDLKDKIVLVPALSSSEQYARANGLKNVVAAPSHEDCLRLLASGNSDCVIMSRFIGLALIRNKSEFSSLMNIGAPLEGFQNRYCIAVSQGHPEILSTLSEGLLKIQSSGSFAAIHQRWFGGLQETGGSWRLPVLGLLGILVLGLLTYGASHLWGHLINSTLSHRSRDLVQTNRNLRLARLSMDRSGEMIYWISQDGDILDANEQVLLQTGYSKQDLTAMKIWQIDRQQSPDSWRARGRVLRGMSQGVFEGVHTSRDGRLLQVENVSTLLEFEGREVILCFVHDISKRKSEVKKLEETALQLRFFEEIIQNSQDMVYGINAEGRFLFANRQALKTLDYTLAEICAMHVWEVDPLFPKDRWPAHWEELREKGRLTFQSVQTTRSGIRQPQEITANLIHHHGEEINVAFARLTGDPLHPSSSPALRARDLRLTQFSVDNAREMIIWRGPDGRILYCNNAAVRRLGYSREELLGLSIFDLNRTITPEKKIYSFNDLREQKNIVFETVYTTKYGVSFPVEISASYYCFEGIEFDCASIRDLTDQHKAMEMVRQSQERHQLALQSCVDGFFELNPQTDEIWYSDNWYLMRGLTPGQPPPSRDLWRSLLLPEDAVRIENAVSAYLQKRTPERFSQEYRSRHKDGSWRWIRVCAMGQWDAFGRCVRLTGTNTDITTQKETELQFLQGYLRHQIATTHGRLAVWELTPEPEKFTVDDCFWSFLGLSAPESPGPLGGLMDILPEEDRTGFRSRIMDFLKNQSGELNFECRCRHRNGSWLWFVVRGLIQKNRENLPVSILGTFSDITAQKVAEGRLFETQQREHESARKGKIVFWEFDVTHTQGRTDDFLMELLGYPGEKCPDHEPEKWKDIYTPESYKVVCQRGNDFVYGKVLNLDYEAAMRHRDGSLRWFRIHGETNGRNERGVANKVIGTMVDITDLKKIQIALDDIQKRQALATRHGRIAFWYMNRNSDQGGGMDDYILDMLGYPDRSWSRDWTEWQQYFAPGHLAALHDHIMQYMEGKSTQISREVRMLHRDGSSHWFLVRGQAMENDPAGLPMRVIGTYIDITELKQVSETLLENRNRLQFASSHGKIVHWEYDVSSSTGRVDDLLMDLLGYPGQPCPSDHAARLALFHPEDQPIIVSLGNQYIEGKLEELSYEARAFHKDGSLRWFRIQGTAASRDSAGRITRVIGTYVDITDYKIAQETLLENRNKLQFASAHGKIIYWEYHVPSAAGRIDDSFMEILGYPGQTTPTDFDQRILLFHPEDRPKIVSLGRQYIEGTSNILSYEVRALHQDGSLRWFRVRGHAVERDASGQMTRILGTYVDITDYKSAQETLQHNHNLYRAMVENFPNGVVVFIDHTLRFVFAGGRGFTETGLNPDLLMGKSIEEAFPEDSPFRRLIIEYNSRTLAGETFNTPLHFQNLIYSSTYLPIHAADGSVIGALSIHLNVTEQTKAEEELRRSLKIKDILVQEVFHRVKNNLQIISTILKMQARETKDRVAVEALTESQNRVSAMSLIHEELYKSDALNSLDLVKYSRNLGHKLLQTYSLPNQNISFEIIGNSPATNLDMAVPIGLILNELVSNSLKHAFKDRRKGHILIQFDPIPGKGFKITVSDNGPGLSKDINLEHSRSLGFKIITLLVRQIHGVLEISNNGGFRVSMSFHY